LQKKPIILRSLLIVATPYVYLHTLSHTLVHTHTLSHTHTNTQTHQRTHEQIRHLSHSCCIPMGWLRSVASLKLYVSFAKEPYKQDCILQKRPIIVRSLLIVATPYVPVAYICISTHSFSHNHTHAHTLKHPQKHTHHKFVASPIPAAILLATPHPPPPPPPRTSLRQFRFPCRPSILFF